MALVYLPATPLPSVQHLTLSSRFGDCSAPVIDPSGDRVAFVCTGDLGNPALGDDYAFCVYDAVGGLLLGASAPAGGMCGARACWKPLGLSGWRYGDKEGTPDGIQKLLLRAGEAGKSRLALKGKGAHLSLPALGALALPLRTQLRSDGGRCWEAQFPQTSVLKSDAGVFKAKE